MHFLCTAHSSPSSPLCSGLDSFKDRFEKGAVEDEAREKPAVETVDVQLKDLKQAFEKVGALEMEI